MELGALVNAVARAANPTVRDGERVALSLKLVVNVLRTHGARPDLLRELRSLAVRSERIVLVQPPAGAARLEIAGQHFVLTDPLRQALLAATRGPSVRPGGANEHMSPADLPRTAPAASQQAMVQQATAGATHSQTGSEALLRAAITLLPLANGVLDPTRQRRRSAEAPRALPLDLPALLGDEPIDVLLAGRRLQTAVQRSPLFLESQVARAAEQGQPPDGVAAARMPSAERAALQLDALRRDAVAFHFNAWEQQPARLDIAVDRNAADRDPQDAAMTPVFTATLQLDLPQLGPVAVRLRLLRDAVAARFETANAEPMQRALPDLAEQLRARGLQPAALTVVADEDGYAA